jgi:alkylation response protein AidB-like acyl-CoA dehydrogenase
VDFSWTDAEVELHRRLRGVGESVPRDGIRALEATQALDTDSWRLFAANGVLGLPIPTSLGGQGVDPVTCAFALEGLGQGCRDNGLLMAMGAHTWAVEVPIWKFGTDEQRTTLLPRMCVGAAIGAHAITETEAGSDALSLKTVATREGDHYILRGSKHFVTNAPVATVFLVYATINPTLGFTGVTAFLVDREAQGVSVDVGKEKMGLRTAPWGELILNDCGVELTCRLGSEKQGRHIFAVAMAWERALMLAPLLGTMQRHIDVCMARARARSQFGQRIGKFQAVARRIVAMQLRLETARAFTYRAAWMLQHDEGSLLSEAAKLIVSEAAVQTAMDAMEIHGGEGYLVQTELERDLRDVLGARVSSGTSDLQQSIIAAKMGIGAPAVPALRGARKVRPIAPDGGRR